jgi:hypothetical protein
MFVVFLMRANNRTPRVCMRVYMCADSASMLPHAVSMALGRGSSGGVYAAAATAIAAAANE